MFQQNIFKELPLPKYIAVSKYCDILDIPLNEARKSPILPFHLGSPD